jgi:xanthine dehydrogenase YagR molybdenum-binding subunit
MPTAWPEKRRLIGTKVSRIDGPAKATGRAKYTFDINRPGMLHAAVLRCPHAHAKIKSLDLTAARKAPGVKALHIFGIGFEGTFVSGQGNDLTFKIKEMGKDVEVKVKLGPNDRLTRAGKDVAAADLQADDKVFIENEGAAVGLELFFAGEEIVAIAADTEEHARDAVRAVKIDYEELEFVVLEADALKQDRKSVPPIGPRKERENVRPPIEGKTDNFEKGQEQAEVTVEGSYGVPTICHQCLESHGHVAEWDADGGLTVWSSTQATTGVAGEVSRYFSAKQVPLAVTKVKIITHHMGGGYGSKFNIGREGQGAAELARKAKAPVKLMLDRAEEITTAGNRPSAFSKVKIGGRKDGTVTAFEVESYGTVGVQGGATVGPLPYVYPFENKRKHVVIRTNAGMQRAMRAPGHPQSCFITDCALDDFAAKIGMDPREVRLKNLPPNDPMAVEKAPTSLAAIRHTVYTRQIIQIAELSGWLKKWHPPGADKGVVKHGIGMALHTWGGQASPQANECTVLIAADGSVTARSSTQDLGTAQRTVTAIVVAELLGLEPGQITVQIGETPFGASSGSGGSTTCPSQAPAALRAVTAALDDFLTKLAPKMNARKEDLVIEPGKVTDKASKKSLEWKAACARLGMEQAKGAGTWTFAEAIKIDEQSKKPVNPNVSNSGVCGVQVAEVLVDTETGRVRCTKVYAVQDCGLIVNKLACESQVAGGVIMGVNYALFEERLMDRVTGRQVNADMEMYKLGGIGDMPEIVVHMMDMPERGVIGIGEPPTISTHAAVGNAVFNALGVRVPHTPFTPENVLKALAQGGK